MQKLKLLITFQLIKNVAHEIQVFKKTLKRFLLYNLFYSIEEYFNSNK
jgi:hypothetical protein